MRAHTHTHTQWVTKPEIKLFPLQNKAHLLQIESLERQTFHSCLVGPLVPETQTSSNAVNQRGPVSGDLSDGTELTLCNFSLVCVCVR